MSENDDNLIVLTDGEGKELECDYIDTVHYGDKDYAVLYPIEQDEDDGEVIILEIAEDDEGMEEFIPVEDEALLDKVFDEFMRISQLDTEIDD